MKDDLIETFVNGCDQFSWVMLDLPGYRMACPDFDFVLSDGISGFIEYQRASRVATLIEHQCPLFALSHCPVRCRKEILR